MTLHSKKIKIFGLSFIGFFILVLGVPTILHALDYVPLVPNSPLTSAASSANVGEFLLSVFKWGVSLAVAMAILFVIYGGVEYMTTDAVFKKEEGREKITAAVAGLLIVFASWLILNTINPDILTTNIDYLGTAGSAPGTGPAGGGPTGGTGGTGGQTGGGTNNGGTSGIPPYGSGGSVNGIPHSGAYNPTLASELGGNGVETLGQLQTDSAGNQYVGGRMSTFGGPTDSGVSPTATGAITGENLRGLDPNSLYIAGRWDYSQTSRSTLQNRTVTVYNPTTNRYVSGVRIVDWGPKTSTGRTWDVSPGVANSVGSGTDGNVWVRFDD